MSDSMLYNRLCDADGTARVPGRRAAAGTGLEISSMSLKSGSSGSSTYRLRMFSSSSCGYAGTRLRPLRDAGAVEGPATEPES